MPGQPLPYLTCNTEPFTFVSGSTSHLACGCATDIINANTPSRIVWQTPGTISLLHTKVISNTSTTTITIWRNGIQTAAELSIGSGLTGYFRDLSGTVTVDPGDDFQYQVVVGGGDITLQGIGVVFQPSGDETVSRLTAGGNMDMGSGTAYFPLFGSMGAADAVEADTQVKVPTPGTARNLLFRLDQNTTTGTTTVRLRKNNANTALSITIASGLTGVFQDVTNEEAIAANDLLDYVVEGGGGGGANLSVRNLCVDFASASRLTVAGGSVTASFNPDFGVTNFTAFQGRFENTTPESHAQLRLGVATFIRGLGILVVANTLDGSTNFRLRTNGANGVSTVVIGAGLTGHFVDIVGQDAIGADDAVCFAGDTTASTLGQLAAHTFYYALGADVDVTADIVGVIGPLVWWHFQYREVTA